MVAIWYDLKRLAQDWSCEKKEAGICAGENRASDGKDVPVRKYKNLQTKELIEKWQI